jgi:hypothetical protein
VAANAPEPASGSYPTRAARANCARGSTSGRSSERSYRRSTTSCITQARWLPQRRSRARSVSRSCSKRSDRRDVVRRSAMKRAGRSNPRRPSEQNSARLAVVRSTSRVRRFAQRRVSDIDSGPLPTRSDGVRNPRSPLENSADDRRCEDRDPGRAGLLRRHPVRRRSRSRLRRPGRPSEREPNWFGSKSRSSIKSGILSVVSSRPISRSRSMV